MSGFVCPKCKRLSRSFWEVQFEFDCLKCRVAEQDAEIAEGERRLREAVKSGAVKVKDLNVRGRMVCADLMAKEGGR